VALLLRNRGILQVRPLLGGLDGWVQRNYPLERIADSQLLQQVVASPVAAVARGN
jgi:3-mercaptopyruvate sulfurtransferase SseA